MESQIVKFRGPPNTKLAMVGTGLIVFFAVTTAVALPADFTGTYQILQSRTLGLTANGRGYVIQDGSLVSESAINHSRAYCRAGESKFDEANGAVDVAFGVGSDGYEHALLKTIPGATGHQSNTIECIAEKGFTGPLDLSVALGRIVELNR